MSPGPTEYSVGSEGARGVSTEVTFSPGSKLPVFLRVAWMLSLRRDLGSRDGGSEAFPRREPPWPLVPLRLSVFRFNINFAFLHIIHQAVFIELFLLQYAFYFHLNLGKIRSLKDNFRDNLVFLH